MNHLQVIKEHIDITLCISFGFGTTARLQHFQPVKELSSHLKYMIFLFQLKNKNNCRGGGTVAQKDKRLPRLV